MNLASIHSVVDLCQALVRIPSENPTGEPSSPGEQALAEFVGEFLSAIGARVELDFVRPSRPNVYGTFPSAGREHRLVFAPHLDTVPVRGMTVDPFNAQIANERLYGRGATDTKGPMAAMLWALAKTDLANLPVAVTFAGLIDEEADMAGSRSYARKADADFAIIGEPTDLNVVYTHKGTAWIEMAAQGKAVHASMPEHGVNAAELLFNAYLDLKCAFPEICPVPAATELGTATISLGLFSAGTKINVVPDHASAQIDIRTIPGQDLMVDHLTHFLAAKHPQVRVRPIKVSRPLLTTPDHPVIQKFEKLGSKKQGASWFCDAAHFAENGVPAIAIGPGSIQQAHTADEYIEVAALESGANFFIRFLESFRHE